MLLAARHSPLHIYQVLDCKSALLPCLIKCISHICGVSRLILSKHMATQRYRQGHTRGTRMKCTMKTIITLSMNMTPQPALLSPTPHTLH